LITLVANVFVFSGVAILIVALYTVRRLIGQLPEGRLRSRWILLTGLIGFFIIGYLGYAAMFRDGHQRWLDLIVPAIFFFGACFVWLTASLSLQTAVSIMRISVLEQETFTDPLTGLFNRRFLDRRLNEELANACRHGIPLSVLMIDIDHFKKINDTHGHQTGDEVLVAMAELLSAELRENDVIARFGGEEFLVIAPHTPVENAEELAERLRTAAQAQKIQASNDPNGVQFTVSIGVAQVEEGTDTPDGLVSAADNRLYRAKDSGRNRVVAFS
jgi:diguanylate cyclase (GGDEF)-like protein